jgi:hypothetical protein
MTTRAVSHPTPVRTIVGVFSNDRKAVEAMRSLDAAGFDADRVQLVGDDPSRAAEIGGKSYAIQGGLAGMVVGVLVVIAFSVWGGLAADPVGLIIGSFGVVGGFTAIGFVIGRATGRHAPDAHLFAAVVRHGGAVVSVQCADEDCDLAAQVLDGAGAREVRNEVGPEAL